MKPNKKTAVVLSLVLTGVLSAVVMSSSATEPPALQEEIIQEQHSADSRMKPRVMAQVGSTAITSKELEDYKAYKSFEATPAQTDLLLLEELIQEELFLQLAKEKGVYATLDEGKEEALRLREILKKQPKPIQETQKNE
ncbi:hypothetical protein [Paenibacillus sp. DMB20]|uniref:hypothetical protein n=1 Tax=Paenibacillus sp. DMB20 TaxID=1642570 RepID=UPI000627745F|nr:hypothetical protein [Paenibacillus sp. DMB20]KKO54935.1 hypothetical protein XI25_04415 [Paenibacillus sp. DMB20]